MMTFGDKLLIVIIIISSVFSIYYSRVSTIEPLEKYIVVNVKGIEVTKIPLNKDKQPKNYSFRFGENIGTLETLNGRVRMLPMDKKICPEGVCSDTGWIENAYQMIVCLPNKIIVTIETNKMQDIDLIVIN